MANATGTRNRSPVTRTSPVLYTPAEVAERLGCCENYVYTLIASGELPTVDIARPGAQRPKSRVRDDHLAAYIDANTRTAVTA
jgi:excisionase family DNA binding protein